MKKIIYETFFFAFFLLIYHLNLIAEDCQFLKTVANNNFEFVQFGDSLYFNNGEYFYTADSLYWVNIVGGKSENIDNHSPITSFNIGNDYSKYIATAKHFFYVLPTGEKIDLIQKFNLDIVLPIEHIEFDSKHNVWFTSKNGLWKIDNVDKNITRKVVWEYKTRQDSITSFRIDKNDNIWFVKFYKDMLYYDQNTLQAMDLENVQNDFKYIFQIRFDDKNNLWFSTSNGLYEFENGEYKIYNESNNNFPSDSIYDFYFEKSDKIWCISSKQIFTTNLNESIDSITRFNLWSDEFNSARRIWIDEFNNKYFLIQKIVEFHPAYEFWVFNEDKIAFTDVNDFPQIVEKIISPNPASDYINIDFSFLQMQESEIRIFDILGNCVLTVGAIYELPLRIDVSALPPGVYFVMIGDKVQKFIKM